MDQTTLETLQRFKQAVMTRQMPVRPTAAVLSANRGRKLQEAALEPKIVEYDGTNYVVTAPPHPDSEDDEDPLDGLVIGELLSGLAHPSELVSHPAISRTYRSKVLGSLASELIELIHTEQDTLNWLNKLLQVLNGEDWYYLVEDKLGLPEYDHGLKGERVAETDDVDRFFQLPEALRRYEQKQTRAGDQDPEEEELINYLQVSIQRQQEYIKNLNKLRNDIVRADRLKSDLYKWGKEMYEKKST